MPRNKRLRKIISPPRFRGYKPYGNRRHEESPVDLLFEEYEAIRLADYKLMNHEEAALHMGVSRPTFARIYENARRKIATALVEAREISTSSGNTYSEKQWHYCKQCHARFTIPSSGISSHCPLCSSNNTETINL